MYHPTTRLLAVLEMLQSRDRVTGAELARRLEVDPRSVRRYVALLQDLGIPVDGARGAAGGYRLRPGYKLPPLLFTAEEAVALTLGLLGLRRSGVEVAATAAEGALAKVARVLPDAARGRVRALQTALSLDREVDRPAVDSALVAALSEAAEQGRRIALRYRSSDGLETERELDPYGVVSLGQYWYVVGYCHLRAAPRVFRLDRIEAIVPREATFSPPVDIDCAEYVRRRIAATGHWPIEVALRLPPAEARRRITRIHVDLEPHPDGVIVRGRVDDLDALARFLIGLGCAFRVRQPAELREALRRLAAEIAHMADEG